MRLAERGHEFGSTTGRARRCGWFDAVILRRSIELNSISGICLTKLDVLDGLETIQICVGYRDRNGDVLVDAPTDADSYEGLQPVYEELPGWSESTVGVKTLEELPANALAYIRRIEALVEAPVDIVSTGPDRNETIVLRPSGGLLRCVLEETVRRGMKSSRMNSPPQVAQALR